MQNEEDERRDIRHKTLIINRRKQRINRSKEVNRQKITLNNNNVNAIQKTLISKLMV